MLKSTTGSATTPGASALLSDSSGSYSLALTMTLFSMVPLAIALTVKSKVTGLFAASLSICHLLDWLSYVPTLGEALTNSTRLLKLS